MAKQTVAEELVDMLVRAGVQRIYGVVGDSLNPITDAVRRSGKIQWVHVRHEEAGAFAAGAEAQLMGRLAVCAGSCGPGHVHLINGLYDAHRSGAPVPAIAAHIPSNEIGSQFFQETHPSLLFNECSHYNETVSLPQQVPRVFQMAMQYAVAKGGVSVVALSGDVAAMPMPDNPSVSSDTVMAPRPTVRPSDADLSRLAELLNGAKRVTIFGGLGCAGVHDELLALAEALKAPIGHTLRGKDVIEHDNPYDVGMTGLIGYGAAYETMHDCDVLLMLGTDFPYDTFLPTKPKIVQVDIRAEIIGRRCRVDLGLCGHIRETLQALLPLLTVKSDRGHLDGAQKNYQEAMRKLNVYVDHVSSRRPIHPEFLAATLNEAASADAAFAVDTGMCTVWAARYIRATQGRSLLGSFNHGSMANALPQAIGTQLLSPDRQVISMSGDGGFAMLMGDLLTILQYDLPVKLVIFNNSALGMVKLEMEVAGYPDWQTDLKNPNFAAMAEAMGMMGIRIEDSADVRAGLDRALAHPGPALVDVVTDPNALSMPPHISAGQVKGFALTMGKLILAGHVGEVVDTIEANARSL